MRKKVKAKTIIFVIMIGFIIGFSKIFGSDNILIGVTTITAVLLFLGKDFSLNPVKTLSKLILFNVAMGIVTFAASKNIILGIPLNFIWLFLMGYTMSHNLSTPNFVPFNLQYVFMLCTPITLDKLPMRLVSLAVGAIIIVLTQVIFNKNKIYKKGNLILANVCLSIINKLDLIENKQSIEAVDKGIKSSINTFRRFIYDRREQEFYFTDEGRVKLNISLELEKINNTLSEMAKQKDGVHILRSNDFKKDIVKYINIVKMCLEKDENLKQIDELFHNIFEKYNKKNDINVFQMKVLNSLFFIRESLYDLRELDKKEYNVVSKLEAIPSNFKVRNIYKASFKFNSQRFSYGFRLAVGITISAFIVEYFKIYEGKWLVYTVNSLIQPVYENVRERTKDRIIATIIGSIVISILFFFIKDTTARSVAIMVVSYIVSFSNSYRAISINATVSGIGAAAMYGDTIVFTIDRFIFVILGAILAVVLSRFAFPFKAVDAKKYLIKLYEDTIGSQINIVKNLIDKGITADDAMKNEILRTNMIEETILANEGKAKDKKLTKYLDLQRLLVLNIFDLYRVIDIGKVKLDNRIKQRIDSMFYDEVNIDYDKVENIINDSEAKYSLIDKIAIIDYVEILIGMNKVRKAAI